MHVAAIRSHGALSLSDPAQDGKAGIEQRQAQHQEGYRKRNDRVKLE